MQIFIFGYDLDTVSSLASSTLAAFRVELTWVLALTVLWSAAKFMSFLHPKSKRSKGDTSTSCATATLSGLEQKRAGLNLRQRGVAPGRTAGSKDSSLGDPCSLASQVTQLCRTQVQNAVHLYRSTLADGTLDLARLPQAEAQQLFCALITSTIRIGQVAETLDILQDIRRLNPGGVSVSLFASATKLCTSKHLFSESLSIYKFMAEDKSLQAPDKSIWSCLLFCAIESRALERCVHFFERVKENGTPSTKDYGNMIRYASIAGDWKLALSLIKEMHEASIAVDSVIYNTSLAVCVGADQVDKAYQLLEEMERSGGVTDVITYNTLLKGFAKVGRLEQCFELYTAMRKRNIVASQVTYGILLDACINHNQVDLAAQVFETMTSESCPMNTVLYTLLIKGFARAGQVDKAMKVYNQMRAERNVPPDVITFSILIKASCDAGRLEDALSLLEAMVNLGLTPDEVVYNNLLGGCAKESDDVLAKKLYKDMVKSGVRPSNATFSIMIRLFSQCKLLDEAVDLLRCEPIMHKVTPEPRLFTQLIQSCIRARQGRRAVEVFKLLMARRDHSPAAIGSILSACIKLNMLDTATELLVLAADYGARVDPSDARALQDAAFRKKKDDCSKSCSEVMQRLGMRGEQRIGARVM